MKKLILAGCLLCLAAPWALAQNNQGDNNNNQGGNNNDQGGITKGHAPEMSTIAMALAGATSLGGYLLVRRRAARHN